MKTRAEQLEEGRTLIESARQSIEEARAYMRANGIEYPLDQWITIRNYAKKYGMETSHVSTWIARGVIPADCVLEIPELNHVRLVRDRVYRDTQVEVSAGGIGSTR